MAVYLVIDKKTNMIINRVEWNEKYHVLWPEQTFQVIETDTVFGDIGWKWDGHNGVNPNPPAPPKPKTSSPMKVIE